MNARRLAWSFSSIGLAAVAVASLVALFGLFSGTGASHAMPIAATVITPTVVATVPAGNQPQDVGVNPTTNRIFVANYDGGNVSVIDGASNTVSATVTAQNHPSGVGVYTPTNRIYVSNHGSHSVTVVDGASDSVSATITVGNGPWGVGVNDATYRIYVANE